MDAAAPTPESDRFLRELDWNLLRTFVVLAESDSVTDAARRLMLKQPSVSAALKRLETRFGKTLIDRSPGRYALTEAGRRLYEEAVEIQGAVLRLSTAVRDVADEVSGHVRIAVASHVVCPVFDDLLAWFHQTYPRATLSIDVRPSRTAVSDVMDRRTTFAVCLVHRRDPKLEYRRLYREFFGLFCGPLHPLFGREGLTLEDLAGHGTVSFETDRLEDVLRPIALIRAAAEMRPRVVGLSSNLEEVRRMILAGLGVGPLPVHVAAPDVREGRLWRLPPLEDEPRIDVHVVWNPVTRLNRAEQAILGELRRRMDEIPIEERTYR
jgi:DNA-binding transcriptional LysR family regulator